MLLQRQQFESIDANEDEDESSDDGLPTTGEELPNLEDV